MKDIRFDTNTILFVNRTLAMSLVMCLGRIATLVGNIGFPILLAMGCEIPFYTMTAMMLGMCCHLSFY